jgi:hypothetical protein
LHFATVSLKKTLVADAKQTMNYKINLEGIYGTSSRIARGRADIRVNV